MKIRTGFVSNSSTSSFVIVGAKIEGLYKKLDEKKMIEIMDKYGIEYGDKYPDSDFWDAAYSGKFDGLEFFGEEDIVGYILASGDECGLEESKTSFKEIAEIEKKVKQNVKEVLDLDIDVQLLTGERCC